MISVTTYFPLDWPAFTLLEVLTGAILLFPVLKEGFHMQLPMPNP